jgi:hypothetical protein
MATITRPDEPASDSERALPDRRYDEFIEGFASLMETRGIPRAAGRIFSYLQVCEPPEQTAAQLSAALGVSLGTVSSMTRLLMQARWVERISRRGERQAVYRAAEGMMMLAVDGVMEPTRRARQLTERRSGADGRSSRIRQAAPAGAQRGLSVLRGVVPGAPRRALSACRRTSSRWSRAARRSSGTAASGIGDRFATAAIAFRSSRCRPARVSAVSPTARPKARPPSGSSHSMRGSSGTSKGPASSASALTGQTSWQKSHPKIQSPMAPASH